MITGQVHSDVPLNRDSPCYISNGEQIVPVERNGAFTIDWQANRHRFIFLLPPDGCRAIGRWWFAAEALPQKIAFTLRADHNRSPFSALHVTDFHVVERAADDPVSMEGPAGALADYPAARQLRKTLLQILKAAPKVAFIIATGDLTNAGDEASLAAVARMFRKFPVPVFPIFGGHDGNVERRSNGVNQYNVAAWSKHLAPPYYSWNWGGRHFLSFVSENTNYLDPVTQQMHDAFVAKDLRLFGKRYPVTVCSHKHPYPWNEAIFHRYWVDSWLHGHFHCNRVSHQQKIRIFSTCPPAFGAMDSDVVPARVLKFAPRHVPDGEPALLPPPQANTGSRSPSQIRAVWKNTSYVLSHLATPCVTRAGIVCGMVDDATGENGGVVCIDYETGDTKWVAHIRGSIQAPVTTGDEKLVATTHDGLIVGISGRSGRILWRCRMPEQHDRWIYAPAAITDDRAIVGTTSCLVCLALKNGDKLWAFRSPTKSSDAFGQFQRASIVDGHVFLAGYRTGSCLLSLSDGELLRKNDDDAMRYSSRVADNAGRYVIGDNAGWLTCFDPRNGAMRWRERISQNIITSAFVPFLDGLLGGTAEGLVYCDADNGRILASRAFGIDAAMFIAYRKRTRSCPGTPVVVGDRAWVASGDGYLNLIEGPRLKMVDRLKLRSPIISGLAISSGGNIHGVSIDGALHCFTYRAPKTVQRARIVSPMT